MKKAGLLLVLFVASLSFAQQETRSTQAPPTRQPNQHKTAPAKKADLSDNYAVTAIKYLTAVQNFELNATNGPIVTAKAKIESAKEDMEAAETVTNCDYADKAPALCPEHMTSTSLELTVLGYVTKVEAYHLDFSAETKAEMSKDEACLSGYKLMLQKRSRETPDACK